MSIHQPKQATVDRLSNTIELASYTRLPETHTMGQRTSSPTLKSVHEDLMNLLDELESEIQSD